MSWRERAQCRGKPTSWFFPESGGVQERVQKLCNQCPVWWQCREAGRGEVFGTWAGVNRETERRQRKNRRAREQRSA